MQQQRLPAGNHSIRVPAIVQRTAPVPDTFETPVYAPKESNPHLPLFRNPNHQKPCPDSADQYSQGHSEDQKEKMTKDSL